MVKPDPKDLPSKAEKKAHKKEKNERRKERKKARLAGQDGSQETGSTQATPADEDTGFISLSGVPSAAGVAVQESARSNLAVSHISGSNAPRGKKRKLEADPDHKSQDVGAHAASSEGPEPKRKSFKRSQDGREVTTKQKQIKPVRAGKKEASANGEDVPAEGTTVDDPTKDQHRFICFIGQLPKSATIESVKKHFSKIQPTSVRLNTDKKTGQGKGFGFIEFSDYDRMKTCLKLYHHSEFDDGTNKPRKINVELTAGGGGAKSDVRKLRIREKNAKLDEERKRRMIEEKKKEADAAKKGDRQQKKNAKHGKKSDTKAGKQQSADVSAESAEGIHPARLAMMSG